jgi:ribosomal peptide maturation radical SAM protein 1
VLLIQLPFLHLPFPSISLALLRSALVEAGIGCDVEYRHLDFGEALGPDLYTDLAIHVDPFLLFGDMIFAPHAWDAPPDLPAVRRALEGCREQTIRGVPARLLAAYPALVTAAGDFLDRTIAQIPWSRYGLVGLSTTFQLGPALALSRRVAQLPSAPPVILGGSQCEGEMGRELMRVVPWIDFAADGDGENLIVGLARYLATRRRSLAGIAGLIWRERGKVRANPAAAAASTDGCALDVLPRPRYDDWIRRSAEAALVPRQRFILPIETSRGCWWGQRRRCAFCGISDRSIRYQRKSPGRALSEFRELAASGVTLIRSVDCVLDPTYFENVIPELAAGESGLSIFYEVRPDLTLRQLVALRDAGIRWLQPGIESLSTPALRLMGKGTVAWRNVRLLRYGAELGLSLNWNLLAGFPGEDPLWYREMVLLAEALSHLQPPTGPRIVRLDRFSPLHESRETNGLADVRPAPGYEIVFRASPESLSRLAMHFSYRHADGRNPSSYLAPLSAACDSWRAQVGRAACISSRRGSSVEIFDTRAIAASERGTLHGTPAAVFAACRHGATAREIERVTAGSSRAVCRALERLVERRWVARIDGRYLSLALPADDQTGTKGAGLAALAERYARQMARRLAAVTRAAPSLGRLRPAPGRSERRRR